MDEGPNSQIEYSIYDTSSNGITELFGINKNTGGISLAKSAVAFGKNWYLELYIFSFE